jgi:hypothetical protein
MIKHIILLLLNVTYLFGFAQFAPSVGQAGTTAIYKDSSVFVAWATGCTVKRGYQDISNASLGYASAGDSSMALGKAGVNGTLSLGDGGYAILTFDKPINNGSGWDFAVFENSFSDTFLELAFVEVSSDGINYYRFPATSNTQDTVQVGSFGNIDATKINDLAGKYRALYGTPFDLQELSGQSGLDISRITHVKIIDVVGCIQNAFATYDQNGKKINDPWNTAFPSSGFDLDAVGVINEAVTGVEYHSISTTQLNVYPNPINSNSILQYYIDKPSAAKIEIVDITGKEVTTLSDTRHDAGWQTFNLSDIKLNNGIYLIHLITTHGTETKKIIVNND